MPCLNRCVLEVGGQPPSMLLPNLNRLVLTPPPQLKQRERWCRLKARIKQATMASRIDLRSLEGRSARHRPQVGNGDSWTTFSARTTRTAGAGVTAGMAAMPSTTSTGSPYGWGQLRKACEVACAVTLWGNGLMPSRGVYLTLGR